MKLAPLVIDATGVIAVDCAQKEEEKKKKKTEEEKEKENNVRSFIPFSAGLHATSLHFANI